jgi:transcription elongation factor GreA
MGAESRASKIEPKGPMMEKIPMTADGYERLQIELKRLKTTERPAVIQALAEAREHGDLSENAEYHAARERQGFIEGRVRELDDKIARAEVIDVSKISGNEVKFGAIVALADEDTEAESTYQLVGADEADVANGLLSITSPLGRALIGKIVGDSILVNTPAGQKSYEIVSIKYH